jgi:lysylphosphatidylglycerol synthetase-like protein (DUF2156 family)
MTGEEELTLERQRRYLMAFGSQSNAYFHFQPGFRYFHLPGRGFVSYHLQAGLGGAVPMVFVKPLCADGDLGPLLEAFLDGRRRAAVFLGMDLPTAEVLGGLGFTVNEFGTEFTLAIQDFTVRGRAMKHLRTVLHTGEKGVEVKEQHPREVPLEDRRRLSDAWLQEQRVKGRELRFLTRPPSFEAEWGVRHFFCYKEGRLVGFVVFDPFFRAGRCLGYCANLLRCEPGLRPAGVLDFAILTALAAFKAEGLEELALGVAPLHGLEAHPGDDRLLRVAGQMLYRWGGCLYNFRDLAFHKTRYRAPGRKLYFCARGLGRLASLGLSLRATQVL